MSPREEASDSPIFCSFACKASERLIVSSPRQNRQQKERGFEVNAKELFFRHPSLSLIFLPHSRLHLSHADLGKPESLIFLERITQENGREEWLFMQQVKILQTHSPRTEGIGTTCRAYASVRVLAGGGGGTTSMSSMPRSRRSSVRTAGSLLFE